jgi:serine/threonine-protein kinase
MEYVIGHTLEDELVEHGRPLDWRRVGTWGIMVAEVLTFLHQQAPPVIHRDLKPANIMLTATGSIKVIDFGSARRQDALRRITTAYLGTEGFVPLEQYSGRSEPRSDLYALGASLYHLLTGYIPKTAPVRFVEGVALKPIRMVNPSVPDALDRVIQQAMQLDARERIADAVSMRQALVWACQRGAQVTGRPAPPRTGAP